MYRCGREGLSWKGVIKKYEKQKKKQISNEEKLEREEVAVVEEIQMALNLIYGRVRRWQKKGEPDRNQNADYGIGQKMKTRLPQNSCLVFRFWCGSAFTIPNIGVDDLTVFFFQNIFQTFIFCCSSFFFCLFVSHLLTYWSSWITVESCNKSLSIIFRYE